ncbi:MAG: type II toxin-antitoxin system VapC family toxin [PVC group bacterium]
MSRWRAQSVWPVWAELSKTSDRSRAADRRRAAMILVDTSVWVDHLRRGIPLLVDLLGAGEVTTHPFVIGELACGNLANRTEIMTLLSSLPPVKAASHSEALHLVEIHSLQGSGIGWIDVHLLSSALLSRVALWTRDRKLQTAAKVLGITGQPESTTT